MESVEITNYNEKGERDEDDEGDLVIRLKIKRKRVVGNRKV